jgi:hypothetical protein
MAWPTDDERRLERAKNHFCRERRAGSSTTRLDEGLLQFCHSFEFVSRGCVKRNLHVIDEIDMLASVRLTGRHRQAV